MNRDVPVAILDMDGRTKTLILPTRRRLTALSATNKRVLTKNSPPVLDTRLRKENFSRVVRNGLKDLITEKYHRALVSHPVKTVDHVTFTVEAATRLNTVHLINPCYILKKQQIFIWERTGEKWSALTVTWHQNMT